MTARKGTVTRTQKRMLKNAEKVSKETLKDSPKKSLVDMALDYFGLGFEPYQIAVMLDIDEAKLEEMYKKYPKLEAARQKKTLLNDAKCRQAMLDLALGRCEVKIEEELLSTSGIPQYKRITKSTVKPELNAINKWLDMNSDKQDDDKEIRINITFDGEDL